MGGGVVGAAGMAFGAGLRVFVHVHMSAVVALETAGARITRWLVKGAVVVRALYAMAASTLKRGFSICTKYHYNKQNCNSCNQQLQSGFVTGQAAPPLVASIHR